jgi:hypothetical protein
MGIENGTLILMRGLPVASLPGGVNLDLLNLHVHAQCEWPL